MDFKTRCLCIVLEVDYLENWLSQADEEKKQAADKEPAEKPVEIRGLEKATTEALANAAHDREVRGGCCSALGGE